ncbi:MAG: hypothetical protein EGR13_09515 [Coprococcus comes]|jgi:hypothetical protein|uniref:Transposase n=1 Tax=Dorea longicatena TaxID=88431 RepID=A0A564SAX9_9FIRM|nr:DUF6262 family protein [Dorea longicatena]MBD9018524.1 hypothetical protein [Coprococcus comes]VUW92199.1 Uncharacterised protein [Dorea longicatena]
MKYDKIVAISKEKSKKKANIAITQIQKMLENQERITVEVLRKRTGFSKSFFYRNQEVWRVLENARSKQQMPCNSMEVIRAIEAEDEIINLRIQITKLKSLRQKLLEENKRLRQELRELSQMSNQ